MPQAALGTLANEFRRDGYTVARRAIGAPMAELCANYALLQTGNPEYYELEGLTGSQGRYADALGECLLLQQLPLMQFVAQGPLLPCYSFLRIYRRGSVLDKHLDRPSCEISTTMTLGFDTAAGQWPIWIEAHGEERALELAPGDMLIYHGAGLPHWRETYNGEFWVQVFLHYVRADGPYTEFKFDGRERIGPFDKRKQRRAIDAPAAEAATGGATATAPGNEPEN
jgi:hypothetical protein